MPSSICHLTTGLKPRLSAWLQAASNDFRPAPGAEDATGPIEATLLGPSVLRLTNVTPTILPSSPSSTAKASRLLTRLHTGVLEFRGCYRGILIGRVSRGYGGKGGTRFADWPYQRVPSISQTSNKKRSASKLSLKTPRGTHTPSYCRRDIILIVRPGFLLSTNRSNFSGDS